MLRLPLKQILHDPTPLISALESEQVIVYPTDTIYGIGGLITPHVVSHIDQIKQRAAGKEYSLIAPDFTRIQQHCEVDDDIETERDQRMDYARQHGYTGITLFLPKRDPDAFALIDNDGILGVRYLQHPLQGIITQIGQPVITTSVNQSGHPSLTDPDSLSMHLDHDDMISLLIDAGPTTNTSSLLVDYVKQKTIPRR